MDYKKLAIEIVESVGTKQNIVDVYHCATRLRFTLQDNSKADKKKIESLEGVITVVEAGGMLQVVIGNSVSEVYDALIEVTGFESTETTAEKKNGNLLSAFIDMISGVFAPTLGVLAGSGLIKGVLALLVGINVLKDTQGTYVILNAAADTFFYFLPIFLAYTASKKFKTDSFIAMTLGASLVYPTIVDAYNKTGSLDFLGLPVMLAKYSSTVIPAILAVWVLSYLERFLRSKFHESVKNLLTPFFCLIIMVPLTLMVVGPIADYASGLLANGYLAVYNFSPALSGALMGGLWQVLVIFGLHWGMVPVMTNNLAFYKRDTLGPGCMMAVASQAGAVLGVFLKTKDKKLKSLSLSAFVSALFGITEPAVYGITLKYKKPFLIACVVGALFGGISGAMGSAALAIATRSVLSFPIYFGKGFIAVVAGYFLSIIVSCILTYLFGYKDSTEEANSETILDVKHEDVKLDVPVEGEVIDLMSVNDKTFASGALGDGFAVIPENNQIKSPVDGVIQSIFPTKHALGIKTKEGAEILIHIGIDTVNLNGKYFEAHVKNGDKVSKGDLLMDVDFQKIKESGYDPTVMVVVTNSAMFKNLVVNK